MDLSQFPITSEMVYTVVGAAAVSVLLTQWLKHYLPDWRFTNLLALAVTLIIVEVSAALFVNEPGLAERLYNGFLISLAGASLATFGYETIMNLLGKAGVGARRNES